jgi:two-component system response regulator AtoC
MTQLRVLVIDDEPALRQILSAIVVRGGHVVDTAAGAREAAAKLTRGDVDVALCDIKMPDGNGIDLLRNSRAAGIDTTFIMVTAFASLETAVDALRAGAADYVTKPVQADDVLHRLTQIADLRELRAENEILRKAVSERAPRRYRFTSPGMLEVEHLALRVAPTDSTVLITGESGTGKGVLARQIHEQSQRSRGLFVAVNCSAIPEHLMESEFFGHTKGAFTSADHARKGLFLQADKGTLFLDEIGDLPLHMQAKLLNAIEEKEVRAVGSEQSRRVDVRVLAATNSNLQERAGQGRFREDLYFRLSMFQIRIPPLRERKSDIRGLIQFLLRDPAAAPGGAQAIELDPLAEEILLAHLWPGNVRELENVIGRARILSEGGRIEVDDLPPEVTLAVSPRVGAGGNAGAERTLREQLRRIEADLALRAIEGAGGDRRLAAQMLGIGVSTLYRKLEEWARDGVLAREAPPDADKP